LEQLMKKILCRSERVLGIVLLIGLLLAFSLTALAQQRGEARPKEWKRPWRLLFEQNMAKYGVQTPDVPYVPLLDYSESCSLCHTHYYKQWQYSAHGTAFTDPFYQQAAAEYREFYDFTEKNIKDMRRLGELWEDDILPTGAQMPEKVDCLSCHAPAINAEIQHSTNMPLIEFLKAMRDGYIPRMKDVASGDIDPTLGSYTTTTTACRTSTGSGCRSSDRSTKRRHRLTRSAIRPCTPTLGCARHATKR
jgi:hypothetical protein